MKKEPKAIKPMSFFLHHTVYCKIRILTKHEKQAKKQSLEEEGFALGKKINPKKGLSFP